MDHRKRTRRALGPYCVSLAVLSAFAVNSFAGDRVRPPVRQRVNSTAFQQDCPCPASSTLGTFEPTPYLMVRGNWPTGGGYTPLETYGEQTLSLYGPLSPLRSIAAPVRTYTRGYDGGIQVGEATSFSNPNLPRLSPVIYPTPASYYYGPRVNRTPPWWSTGTGWVDQQ